MLSGLSFGCYKLLTAPQLRITQVRVIGTKLVSADAVQADAKSVAFGKNILIFSKDQISLKTRKNRPEIQKITIGRILPRTIVLRITERKPFLALQNTKATVVLATADAGKQQPEDVSFWLVDNAGTPFHKVKDAPSDLAIVDIPLENNINIQPGKSIKDPSFMNALKCLRECNTISYKVSKISVDRVGNLCLNNRSNFYVKLGLPLDIPKKLKDLPRIVQGAQDRGLQLEYIDLSCPGRAAWKVKTDSTNTTETTTPVD